MSGMEASTFKLILDKSVSQLPIISFQCSFTQFNIFEEKKKTLKKPHINVTPEN